MIVFITGANSGIGMALAREYARRGATLGLLARRGEALEALATELGGGAHRVYAVDVRDRAALHAAAADFIATTGCPDIVIANAGISVGNLTSEVDDFEDTRAVFEINVLGLIASFEPFIGPMRHMGGGQLVGIASVAGVRGLPGAGAYSASKAAVATYCESLRNEVRRDKIYVTTLSPGYIRTPLTAGNPYRMPFLLDPAVFAQRAAVAIERRVRSTVIPWQMGVVAWFLRRVPDRLFDMFAENGPRKPRRVER